MVITITSPGYKYTSEMTKQVSSDTKASVSKSADNSSTLQEFKKILADKIKEAAAASADSSSSKADSVSSATDSRSSSAADSTSSASKSDSASSVDTGLGFSIPSSLESIFEKAADKYGVDVKLLETIGYNESRFQTTATSSSGAKGIMQLMPVTAKSYGVSNAYDPEQNIMAGAHLISDKLKEFNGNVDLAVGAYACGSGAIHQNGDQLTTAGRYYVEKFRKYYN